MAQGAQHGEEAPGQKLIHNSLQKSENPFRWEAQRETKNPGSTIHDRLCGNLMDVLCCGNHVMKSPGTKEGKRRGWPLGEGGMGLWLTRNPYYAFLGGVANAHGRAHLGC